MAETNSEWFDKIYQKYSPGMRSVAKAALGSIESAEDIVQDVFILLLAKQDEVRKYQYPRGWLYKTLRNLIGNYLQKEQYRKSVPLEEQAGLPILDTYQFSLADSLPKGLTSKEQEILILFFDAGLSYEEIAERLDCSILTCRTRLHRAKARYKELYLKENEKFLI